MSSVISPIHKAAATPLAQSYSQPYFWAFLGALLLCLSPSNILAYMAPAAVIAIFLLLSRSHTVLRNILLWFIVWGIIIAFYALLTPDFLLHSSFLSILTYSSFLVVLTIPHKFVANQALLDRMMEWVRWVVIIEALVGITQGIYGFTQTGRFDGANGDFVEGTIHLALAPELAFSNPMFAINMTFFLIALLPDLMLRRKGVIAIILGGIALIMASVIHVLMMLAAAGIIAVFLYWPISLRQRMTPIVLAGLCVAITLSFFTLRNNFLIVTVFAQRLLNGESYRSIAIKRAIYDLPNDYELYPLVGLGPGQFSSRAGLIGTGLYFGGPVNPRPLPLLPQGMSPSFEAYTLDLWLAKTGRATGGGGGDTGSTNQPFLSWLSLYTEWGILVFFGIFLLVAYLLIRVRLKVRTYPQRILAYSFGTSLLLLLFLGAQENYWEIPQAILIGLIILKVQYAVLMTFGAPKASSNIRRSLKDAIGYQ
ncbi:MAG: hypothetical protein AAF614_16360 [Chloroflexota bacterium]